MDQRQIEHCLVEDNALQFLCCVSSATDAIAAEQSATDFVQRVYQSFDHARANRSDRISFSMHRTIEKRVSSQNKSLLCEDTQQPLSCFFLRSDDARYFEDELTVVTQATAFTNFDIDIPASTAWPSIKRNDVISSAIAKRLLERNDVRCDGFCCNVNANFLGDQSFRDALNLFPFVDSFVHLARDRMGMMTCDWCVFNRDAANCCDFSRKSIISACIEFCAAMAPIRLPVYVVEQVFNDLLCELVLDVLRDYVAKFKRGTEKSIRASVYSQLQSRWHTKKIATIQAIGNREEERDR